MAATLLFSGTRMVPGLAPLFDFAPMWLHPDGIARKMRWDLDDGGSPDWNSAIAQAAEAGQIDRDLLIARIRPMAAPLANVYTVAIGMGIDEQQYLKPIAHAIDRVRAQVEKL